VAAPTTADQHLSIVAAYQDGDARGLKIEAHDILWWMCRWCVVCVCVCVYVCMCVCVYVVDVICCNMSLMCACPCLCISARTSSLPSLVTIIPTHPL